MPQVFRYRGTGMDYGNERYPKETEGQHRARVQGEAYGDYLADHLTVSPTFYDTQSPLSKIAERSTRERYKANTGYNLPESPF